MYRALGELGIPDRYIDVFQGRSPRNVLAITLAPVIFTIALTKNKSFSS